MACSRPGFPVHGIFQARILEWVTISFSRRSSQPRDWTQVSCIVGRHFTFWATREVAVRKELPKSAIFMGFHVRVIFYYFIPLLTHVPGWELALNKQVVSNSVFCTFMEGIISVIKNERSSHTDKAISFWKWSESESCSVMSDSLWPHGLYTVHGVIRARILEWVAFPFSRGSSQPRDRTQVSCIAGRFLMNGATREATKEEISF